MFTVKYLDSKSDKANAGDSLKRQMGGATNVVRIRIQEERRNNRIILLLY